MIVFILNLLWFVFGSGALMCIGWLCAGALLAITVIGLPFARAAFRIAGYVAFPFGRERALARWAWKASQARKLEP
jgi:uncharacterized membrane protein YccF (DUF307 family)